MSTSARYFGSISCFVVLFLGFALLALPAVGRAQNAVDDGSAQGFSASSTTGYITLLLTGEANGSGSTMTGGEISLYCVATVDRSVASNGTYDILGGQFASSKDIADLGTWTKEQLDANNPTISEALEKDVRANRIKPLQTATISDGKVTFSQLNEGLYLLVQTTPSDGDRAIRSFMMSVPNEDGEFGVVAKPKPGAWDGAESDPKKDDPQKDDPQKDDPKKDDPQKDDSATGVPAAAQSQKTTPATIGTPLVEHRVPATGDHMPSFVLAAVAGAGLAVAGACGRRAKRARRI